MFTFFFVAVFPLRDFRLRIVAVVVVATLVVACVVVVVVVAVATFVVVVVVVLAIFVVVVVVAVVRLKAINNSCAVCLFRLLSIVIGRQKWNGKQADREREREKEIEGERVSGRERKREGESSCPIAWSAAARSHKTRLKFHCLAQVFLLLELKKCHMTLIKVWQG